MGSFAGGPGRKWAAVAFLLLLGLTVPLPVASEVFLRQSGLASRHSGVERAWQWAAYKTADLSAWPSYARARNETALRYGMQAGGAAGAFLLLLAGRVALRPVHKPLYGESKFCTKREARRAGFRFSYRPPDDAVILGIWDEGWRQLYVSLPGEEHLGVWARTRSGKGVSLMIPNLLKWGGSVVAFSVKKDLAEATAGRRESMGDHVSVFAPGTPDWRTHRWNLLSSIKRDRSPGAFDAAQRGMWSIIPKAKTGNPYWDNAARRVATAVAVILAETPGAVCTVSAVSSAVGRADFDKYLRGLIQKAREEGRPYPAKAVNAVLSWLDNQEKDGGKGVRDTILTALGLWDNEVVDAATSHSDVDLATIRNKRTAAFIAVEPADTERMGPIVAAFFKTLIAANTRELFRKLPEPRFRTLMLMDEFTAPDEIPIVARAGAYLADFGIRIFFAAQAKEQLEAVYGASLAKSIALNTGAEIIFGGSDLSLCKEFSERGGRDTVKEKSRSGPKWGRLFNASKDTESESVRPRPTILPQEIHRLDSRYLLVHRPGCQLLKLRRIIWYDDPNFKNLARSAPVIPKLEVFVDRDAGKGNSEPPNATKDKASAAWGNGAGTGFTPTCALTLTVQSSQAIPNNKAKE